MKLTLQGITNFFLGSAVSTTSANNTAIQNALENTLSRDGTAPNQMGADFDVNGHRILNLPTPLYATDPVRLVDAALFQGPVGPPGVPGQGANTVTLYGAKGDGVTDDTAAFQLACDTSKITGNELIVPPGKYLINGSITVEDVTIRGTAVAKGDLPHENAGSVIYIKQTNSSPFKLHKGASLIGLNFFYPNQVDSATPIVYPTTVSFDMPGLYDRIQFCFIQNCTFFNSYVAIDWNDPNRHGGTGHIWIVNNTIYGIYRCIVMPINHEVVKVLGNTFTFGHFLPATETGLRAFTRANGTIFEYQGGDGIWFCHNLCFGYLRGFSINTAPTNLNIIANNSFDQVRYGFSIYGNGGSGQTTITGNVFYPIDTNNLTADAATYDLQGTGKTAITSRGNYHGPSSGNHIVISGVASGYLTIYDDFELPNAYQRTDSSYASIVINNANMDVTAQGNVLGDSAGNSYGILAYSVRDIQENMHYRGLKSALAISGASRGQFRGMSSGTVSSISDNITMTAGTFKNTGFWDKPGPTGT